MNVIMNHWKTRSVASEKEMFIDHIYNAAKQEQEEYLITNKEDMYDNKCKPEM